MAFVGSPTADASTLRQLGTLRDNVNDVTAFAWRGNMMFTATYGFIYALDGVTAAPWQGTVDSHLSRWPLPAPLGKMRLQDTHLLVVAQTSSFGANTFPQLAQVDTLPCAAMASCGFMAQISGLGTGADPGGGGARGSGFSGALLQHPFGVLWAERGLAVVEVSTAR